MAFSALLWWAGHVSRMEDHCLPKIVMFGELSTSHRERGAPKKRVKDSRKKSLTTCNIDHRQWSDLAANRVAWCHTIHQAAAQFKVDRKNSLKDKRQRRKARATSTTTPDISFPCSHCSQPQATSLQSTWTWTNFLNLCLRSHDDDEFNNCTVTFNNLRFKFVS